MVWLRHSIPNKLIPSLWWTAYFLMEKSLVWYLVFLSFKINSVVLNVCWHFRHSLFHLDRQIFQSLGLRSKRSAKFPDLIVIWSLVPLFIWGVFILLSWLIFVLFTNIFTKILLITTFLAMSSREIFLWIDQFLYQLSVFNVFNFFFILDKLTSGFEQCKNEQSKECSYIFRNYLNLAVKLSNNTENSQKNKM